MAYRSFFVLIAILLCQNIDGKLFNKTHYAAKSFIKTNHGSSSLMFVDELKQTLEKYLFGICPQGYKIPIVSRDKNSTLPPCDLDSDQHELAARLASLALRAHSTRGDCQISLALSSTFSEMARTAAERQQAFDNSASNENKKRKLSKSQKAKLQAKQRTALVVKKKAAALAAAAAAKISS